MNIDETNIHFDMESGLTLVDKVDKLGSPNTSGSSMRCTVLLGVTLNGEMLTPLVVLMGKFNGRIARKDFLGCQHHSNMFVKTRHGLIKDFSENVLWRFRLHLL